MKFCPVCGCRFADPFNYCVSDGSRLSSIVEMQNADTIISADTLIMPMTQEDARLLFNKSAVEQAAAKLNDAIGYKKARSQWRYNQGIQDAANEVKILFNDLRNLAEKVSEKNPHVAIRFSQDTESHCTVSSVYSEVYLSVNWGCSYMNELDSYTLSFVLYKGRYPHTPQELSVTDYESDIDEALRVGWREKEGGGQFFTSVGLADQALSLLIDYLTRDSN